MIFRASAIGKLMTEPKLKSDKESGNLSETAKAYVRSLWLELKYGYTEPFAPSIEMLKGTMCEADSMDLVQSVLGGEFRAKNIQRIFNGNLSGTPDIVLKDCVEDIKTSWSLRTFSEADGTNSDYYWQAMAYMYLTGKRNYRLIYALVPTPDELLQREIYNLTYKYWNDQEAKDKHEAAILQNNALISKIDPKERVKVFKITYNTDDEVKMLNRIHKAIEYTSTLKL